MGCSRRKEAMEASDESASHRDKVLISEVTAAIALQRITLFLGFPCFKISHLVAPVSHLTSGDEL